MIVVGRGPWRRLAGNRLERADVASGAGSGL